MTSQPTHVYYNVRIQNGNTDGTDAPCTFREQRTVPIVDAPSDYFFSCVRFNVPTSKIPLLIIPVRPFPNTDPSQTIYAISLSKVDTNGVSQTVTQNVVWSPNELRGQELVTPQYRLTEQSPYTNSYDSFYYCWSYVHFTSLVNAALNTAFETFKVNPAMGIAPTARAPFFSFDSTTKLFTLHAEKATFDTATVNNPVSIALNNALSVLYGGFNSKIDVANQQRILLVSSKDSTNNPLLDGDLLFPQEYSTLVNWIGFRSIIITTGTIPLVPEGIPAVTPFFSNNNLSNTGQPSFLSIVSDFDALLDSGGYADFQSSFQYAPSGEYRLVDFRESAQPLTSFDITVYFSDLYGCLHTLMIASNETASFKFLLRKKTFNRSP